VESNIGTIAVAVVVALGGGAGIAGLLAFLAPRRGSRPEEHASTYQGMQALIAEERAARALVLTELSRQTELTVGLRDEMAKQTGVIAELTARISELEGLMRAGGMEVPE
jgi:acetylornithine/succinyldiaminopimelate/putrescine aminotransferase